MRRISLYISEPQYKDFQTIAAKQGRPYSELIREALSQYLRRHQSEGGLVRDRRGSAATVESSAARKRTKAARREKGPRQ